MSIYWLLLISLIFISEILRDVAIGGSDGDGTILARRWLAAGVMADGLNVNSNFMIVFLILLLLLLYLILLFMIVFCIQPVLLLPRKNSLRYIGVLFQQYYFTQT